MKDLDRLQELLYAEHKHKLLIVLQGTDTSGKDGTIRHVFSGVNPQGVRVASFKAPTPEELAHDFLWRIHKQMPGTGEIVIFNRSHYEDVLIVRVHGLVSREECRRRYADINAFEQMLVDEGTTILKFFLHIDKAEQKKRLEARLAEKDKHWKFNPDDLKERALLARLYTRVRRCIERDEYRGSAVVHHSRESQMVSQFLGLENPGRVFERSENGVPQDSARA